jgi:hypothetical protein
MKETRVPGVFPASSASSFRSSALRMILPPRPTKGLGRHESTRRIDQRQTCQFIAPVERETRQNFPAEKSGTHAVSGEAESVMHAAAAAEDRQMRRGHIDRPPPRAFDTASAQRWEKTHETLRCLSRHADIVFEPPQRK